MPAQTLASRLAFGFTKDKAFRVVFCRSGPTSQVWEFILAQIVKEHVTVSDYIPKGFVSGFELFAFSSI